MSYPSRIEMFDHTRDWLILYLERKKSLFVESLVWCHRPRGVQRELYTQRPSIESSERNVKSKRIEIFIQAHEIKIFEKLLSIIHQYL
uniref:Uncharacterized protein n=1 Tax=Trichogramma kaykai TaxID=54128 RepID=A0ABD2VTC1_9HYME